MKIMYCLAGTFNSGGMERIVIAKANWLANHGFDVVIVTSEQDGRPDFFKLNPLVKRIDLDILYSRTNNFGFFSKLFVRTKLLRDHKRKLEAAIESENPDIVISTFGNEIGLVPGIKHRCKKIAEIHFSRWYRLQLKRKGLWRLVDKVLTAKDKRHLKRYDRFVCLTEEDRKNWGNVNNLEVIPNFIGARAPRPALLDEKSMIAVGRLSYQKGYDRLLNAWKIVSKKHSDWHLKIYGGGELESDLRNQISTLNLQKNVTIHKPVSDIESEYLKSSALVLSSHYEGLPMVLLEASAAGLPLVAFACQCGPRDIISSGYNGILVDEGDVDCLAKSIVEIIEDTDLRKLMGKNAYDHSGNYLIEQVMPRWVELFHKVQ